MSSQPSICLSHKASNNILDDLKKELSREEIVKPRELARTDQIRLKNKFDSRSSSKKREITRIDSVEKREITRIDSVKKISNQDWFYNNSFKQPNETLNLELETIKPLTKHPINDPLKSNVGKDYLGLSI